MKQMIELLRRNYCFLPILICMLFISGCGPDVELEEGNYFVFYQTLYPEGRDGMVSLMVRDHMVTDDFNYNVNFRLLKKYGLKATFFLNAAYVPEIHGKIESRLFEYIADGHEIGLFIREDKLAEFENAEDLVNYVKQNAEIMHRKLGIELKSITVEKEFGNYPLAFNYALEQAGYYVDNNNYYLNHYIEKTEDLEANLQPAPDELGKEVELLRNWEKFRLAINFHINEPEAKAYQEKMFLDLTKRNLYIAPFGTCEKYRRDRSVSKLKISDSNPNGFTFYIDGAADQNFYFVCQSGFRMRMGRDCREVSNIKLASGKANIVYSLPGNNKTVVRFAKPQPNFSRMRALNLPFYPEDKDGCCVLTFDDTNQYQYNIWYPMLKSNGLKASFFLYGNGNLSESEKETMFPEFMKMQDDGYEIGCHSFSHMVKEFSKIANHPEFFEKDTEQAVAFMKECGFHVSSYVFPGNYHTGFARDIVRKYYPWVVKNERCVLREKTFKMDASMYLDLLSLTRGVRIEMIHEPIWNGEDIKGMYEPFFKKLSQNRDTIAVPTFGQLRTYEAIRNHSRFVIQKSTDEGIEFKLESENSNVEMDNADVQVFVDTSAKGEKQVSSHPVVANVRINTMTTVKF